MANYKIDLITKTIIPDEGSVVLVKGEHLSQTITFTCDRYFNGIDLKSTKIAVHYVNALGEQDIDTSENDNITIESDTTSILIKWKVGQIFTSYTGDGKIAVQFYKYLNSTSREYSYCLRTQDIKIPVKDSFISQSNLFLDKFKYQRFLTERKIPYEYNKVFIIDNKEVKKLTSETIDISAVGDNGVTKLYFILNDIIDGVKLNSTTGLSFVVYYTTPSGVVSYSSNITANFYKADGYILLTWEIPYGVTSEYGDVAYSVGFMYDSDETVKKWFTKTSFLHINESCVTLDESNIGAINDNLLNELLNKVDIVNSAYGTLDTKIEDVTTTINNAKEEITNNMSSVASSVAEVKDASDTIQEIGGLFVKAKNIFNGYRHDFTMNTSFTAYWNDITPKTGVIVNVKPSTTYTIIKEPAEKESTYYYYRLITFKDLENGLAYRIDNKVSGSLSLRSYKSDDSVEYLDSGIDTTVYTFTTGANDDTLALIVAEEIEPKIQILEGEYTEFQSELYNLEGVNTYNTEEVDELISTTKNEQIGYTENYISECSRVRITNTGNGTINISKRHLSGNYTCYVISKILNETTNYSGYKFARIGFKDSSDTWRYILYNGIECEGAIKEKGATDFVCGFHGDEIQDNAYFVIDGVKHEMTENFDLYADSIDFITSSIVYHCNTMDIAFERKKKITFSGDTLTLYNNFYTKSDFYVETAALCMIVASRESLNEKLVAYSTNKDFQYTNIPDSNGTDYNLIYDADISSSSLYGTNSMVIDTHIVNGSYSNSMGGVTDFQNRMKLYNHIMTNTQLKEGDRLYCIAEYKIMM